MGGVCRVLGAVHRASDPEPARAGDGPHHACRVRLLAVQLGSQSCRVLRHRP